ncbi:hypothetical protein Plhal304r1_c001g0001061 [Plasmopara halstedii]
MCIFIHRVLNMYRGNFRIQTNQRLIDISGRAVLNLPLDPKSVAFDRVVLARKKISGMFPVVNYGKEKTAGVMFYDLLLLRQFKSLFPALLLANIYVDDLRAFRPLKT